MNPAEAFIFGAAVLVHDAGMSIASYPGGLKQLKKTTEWRDSTFSACRAAGITPTEAQLENPPHEVLQDIVFSVLRALHAKNAEELVFVTWPLPSSNDSVRLLEDNQLRMAYGRAIGQIAHSHNWSIEKVTQQLRSSVGAAADLPQDWKIDEIKIACLLRCSDAAHVDHRRAPSLLYALRRPSGVAGKHWSFQNRLNKPTISSGALVYSSGENFGPSEAHAWWLCYDTIRMINKELQDSNAALQDSQTKPFLARRVYGAEGPSILARQVQVNGWRPVDAEIRATDPIRLARTLGGSNLYGEDVFAPIRELLQNAVDAVRARRRIDNRPDTWGKIKLTIENSNSEIYLHVDDTGVGMSERTLVGPLLDFGNSFWSSPAIREEWPGLESSGLEPVGKFGIGFFAVFVLGEEVVVVSRRFDAAVSDTRCLEFTSILGRPIVRDARPGELPPDFSTRVSVKIIEKTRTNEDGSPVKATTSELLTLAFGNIRRLISAIDVDIDVEFKLENKEATHSAGWIKQEAHDFLEETLSHLEDKDELRRLSLAHADHLTLLQDKNGTIYGRAAIAMHSKRRFSLLGGLSIGGFLTATEDWFVGVMNGETTDAARRRARLAVPSEVLNSWASEQARLIDRSRFSVEEQHRAAHRIRAMKGDPGNLPFCFAGTEFIPYRKLEQIAQEKLAIHLLLTGSGDALRLTAIDRLDSIYYRQPLKANVMCLEWRIFPNELFHDGEQARAIMKSEGGEVGVTQFGPALGSVKFAERLLADIWKKPISMRVRPMQVFDVNFHIEPNAQWVLTLAPET